VENAGIEGRMIHPLRRSDRSRDIYEAVGLTIVAIGLAGLLSWLAASL
jgi:hypothetical protein